MQLLWGVQDVLQNLLHHMGHMEGDHSASAIRQVLPPNELAVNAMRGWQIANELKAQSSVVDFR